MFALRLVLLLNSGTSSKILRAHVAHARDLLCVALGRRDCCKLPVRKLGVVRSRIDSVNNVVERVSCDGGDGVHGRHRLRQKLLVLQVALSVESWSS